MVPTQSSSAVLPTISVAPSSAVVSRNATFLAEDQVMFRYPVKRRLKLSTEVRPGGAPVPQLASKLDQTVSSFGTPARLPFSNFSSHRPFHCAPAVSES